MTFGKAVKSNVLQTSRFTHNISNDNFISNNIINIYNDASRCTLGPTTPWIWIAVCSRMCRSGKRITTQTTTWFLVAAAGHRKQNNRANSGRREEPSPPPPPPPVDYYGPWRVRPPVCRVPGYHHQAAMTGASPLVIDIARKWHLIDTRISAHWRNDSGKQSVWLLSRHIKASFQTDRHL